MSLLPDDKKELLKNDFKEKLKTQSKSSCSPRNLNADSAATPDS